MKIFTFTETIVTLRVTHYYKPYLTNEARFCCYTYISKVYSSGLTVGQLLPCLSSG